MKKLMLVLFALIGLQVATFAADAFLGWKCQDVAAMKTALTKSDADVPVWSKRLYYLQIAEIENPAAMATFAKAEEFLKSTDPKITPDASYQILVQYQYCRGESRWTSEIMADPRAETTGYIAVYYKCVGPKNVGLKISDAEMKQNCIAAAKSLINSNNPTTTLMVVDRYLSLSIEDEDEIVVKNLKMLYRFALPKLSASDSWKPVVVKLTLGLKGRGIEVK